MANAALGVPVPYTVTGYSSSPIPLRDPANVANDEPGLVGWGDTLSAGSSRFISISLSRALSPHSFCCVLGTSPGIQVRVVGFSSLTNMNSGLGGTLLTGWVNTLSTKSSDLNRKHLSVFNGGGFSFVRVEFLSTINGTSLEPWRVLLGDWVEPSYNIEVGAQSAIDDRQRRQYAPTGRRNFFNTGIYPAFTGAWSWIEPEQYKRVFRPLTLLVGGSVPLVFCLDRENTECGEDDTYYGDLEKEQVITHEDGQMYSYGFTIVSVAPIEPNPAIMFYQGTPGPVP